LGEKLDKKNKRITAEYAAGTFTSGLIFVGGRALFGGIIKVQKILFIFPREKNKAKGGTR